MNYRILYLKQAINDLNRLDNSQRKIVLKAINKVSKNPLSIYEGGYGKPLGNKAGNKLQSFLKIKIMSLGIRVVYQIVKSDQIMTIIVIGARADNEVYEEAARKLRK